MGTAPNLYCKVGSKSHLYHWNQAYQANSAIEGDVGIMCACMPFFPALIKDSPTIQHILASLRSWVTRTKPMGSTSSTTRSSHPKYLKAYGAEGDYVELGEARVFAQPARVHTFRAGFEEIKP